VPKIKTHQATAKRFRKTGSGKIVRMKARRSHLRRRRSKRVLRSFDRKIQIENYGDVKRVVRCAPYLN